MTEAIIQFLTGLKHVGIGAWIAFALFFIVSSFVFIPRPILCMASGATLGISAVALALGATTTGAVLAFLAARYLGRPYFHRRIERWPISQTIMRAVDDQGWKIVGLLRIASPIPGPVNNYLFGLTGIRVWPYTAATLVGVLPKTLLFVGIGASGQMILSDTSNLAFPVVAAAGLVCGAVSVFLVALRTKALLAQRGVL